MTEIFATREEGKVMIIEIMSKLDMPSLRAIKNHLVKWVKKKQNFIINLSHIDSTNSAMVGTLIEMRNLVTERGGDLVLCFVKPSIRCLFDLMGLSEMLKIHCSEADAIASFQT